MESGIIDSSWLKKKSVEDQSLAKNRKIEFCL